jgi:hypothetical protein
MARDFYWKIQNIRAGMRIVMQLSISTEEKNEKCSSISGAQGLGYRDDITYLP